MRHLRQKWAFHGLIAPGIAAALAVGAACSKPRSDGAGQPEPPAAPTPSASTPAGEARAIYNDRCARCHGADGKGSGSLSAGLSPKPRDYTSAEWQKSVGDADLRAAIVKGGPAIGRSPLMPASPDLADKPEVVTALVAIVRSFGK